MEVNNTMYNKLFSKRILLIFVLDVYSEYRDLNDYKIFINIYLFDKFYTTRLFNLTFRTSNDTLGTYNYLGKFVDNAMTLIKSK